MKKSIVIFLLIFNIKVDAQFIDANIFFKPRLALETEYIAPQSSNNLDGYSSRVSLLLPIKNNFDLGVSVKDLIKSTSIKDALKKVQPSMSQTFLRLEGGHTELYSTPYQTQQYNQFKIGITGIKLSFQNLKLKSLLYSVNAGIYESFDNYSTPSIYVNGMIGSVKVLTLNSLFFYGAYVSYYDKQFLASPLLGYYIKVTPKISYSFILPSQTKVTYSASPKYKQDLVFGFNSSNYGNKYISDRASFRNNQLYASTQARIKLSKKTFFYLEGGYKFNRSISIKDGYNTLEKTAFSNALFVKGTLIFNFNKALLNLGVFDLDI